MFLVYYLDVDGQILQHIGHFSISLFFMFFPSLCPCDRAYFRKLIIQPIKPSRPQSIRGWDLFLISPPRKLPRRAMAEKHLRLINIFMFSKSRGLTKKIALYGCTHQPNIREFKIRAFPWLLVTFIQLGGIVVHLKEKNA